MLSLSLLRRHAVLPFVFAVFASTLLSGDTKPADYSREAAVYEHIWSHYRFESDGRYVSELDVRVRMQSEGAVQQHAMLAFPYASASDDMTVESVRTIKKDGTSIVTPEENIQDVDAQITHQAPMYSDIRQKQVAVKGLSVGDILEYKVRTISKKPLIPGQFWFAAAFTKHAIVLAEEIQVDVPAAPKVLVRNSGIEPQVAEHNGRKIYTWHHENLSLEKKDPLAKYPERDETPAPDVELSTFQSWDELAAWYDGLMKERVEPTAEIRAKAAELTKNAKTDDEKIAAIYNYVGERLHYIGISFGIGRFQPHAAADVLGNQFGDCKDKHTLLASLLSAAGIQAYPALLNTERLFDKNIPLPSAFDHMITAIPRGEGYLWLDTTAEVAPFGMLLPAARDKDVLVIVGGKGRLTHTPADAPFQQSDKYSISAKLDSSGTLEGAVERSVRGDTEVLLRLGLRNVGPSRYQELMQAFAKNQGFGGAISDAAVSDPEQNSAPLRLQYRYKRMDYSDWENRRISPPLPPIFVIDVSGAHVPTKPIALGELQSADYSATIEMPKDTRLTVPRHVDEVFDFAEYHSHYSFQDGVLKAERKVVILKREIPADRYADFRGLTKAILDDQSNMIIVNTAAPSKFSLTAARATGGLTADELNAAGREALQQRSFVRAVDLFQRAVTQDPQNPYAWNNLGLAKMSLGRVDEAAAAFRKQLELNPQDKYAWNNLGRVLATQRKFDEAADAFRKQLAIDPHDRWASANLGALLVTQKKYQDAVNVLEAAAPDPATTGSDPRAAVREANRLMQLGLAYVGLGQTDKGLSAFESATKTLPGPMTLNNIAYQLADKGLQLDVAQMYVAKAVAELNSSVDHLDLSGDLHILAAQTSRLMTELGNTWDTLGWLYFRQNDLARAEKYLAAAWNLNQDGVIGEHLAEVYEKQGHRQKAGEQYVLALAAGHPPRETRDRLTRLNVVQNVDREVSMAVSTLSKSRSTSVAHSGGGKGSAEFLVSFLPDAKVADVKFLSGDEQLRDESAAIAAAKFNVLLPDADTKLIRRGILACEGRGPCQFVLVPGATVPGVGTTP